MRTGRTTYRKTDRRRVRRRGFSALIVLLLIAVTLGLSYASIRSQSVNTRVQRNASFRVSARAAAMSGLATALKVMHTAAWQGVDTTLTGRLSDYENFEVRFTTGDPMLSAGDADYDRYPLRVTLDSTGYAADPISASSIATYRAQAVVELIPRALPEPPAGFDDLLRHTLSQWDSGECSLCVPFRVEGAARFRGRLNLSQQLQWATDPWWWYHVGLNEMRLAGRPDWRPLTGPVRFTFSQQDANVTNLIQYALQAPMQNTPLAREFTWQNTASLTAYRLYPGGKVYSIPTVSGSLQNIQLAPDPKTNPAGLFVRSGLVELRDNVTIRGSLFTRGGSLSDIEVHGNGVRLEPVDLPPLDGTSEPVHLPALVSADDLRFHSGARAELKGLVLAQDDLEVYTAHQNQIALRIEGHAAGRDLYIRPRDPWDRATDWWNGRFILFWLQRSAGIPWFPEWLRLGSSLAIQPQIVFAPNPRSIRYHYYSPDQPIYVPHPDDEGLRWNVVRWTMNP
ncbi:MAG: hypothetical protein RBS80_14465 [Thermoguttaceae bacterium]|jgi:hypothetical protein|nr:hypothetical protein [Thermoguttaceae bacterium]